MTDEKIYERLAKVLALTKSPNENEASAAAEMLQKLLVQYNLGVADLEGRGQKKPGIRKDPHDLGKAAFTWKLELADTLATHFFCHAIIHSYGPVKNRSVAFVGRPDNVESLQLMYKWLMDQIKDLSRAARKLHHEETGEHIDPLRWQVNFGQGCADRLARRFRDLQVAQSKDATSKALVLSHNSEISDWLELQGLRRIDGQLTQAQKDRQDAQAKWDKEWQEAMDKQNQERQVLREACLKTGDMKPFYEAYPGEDPEVIAAEAARRQKRMAEERKREERNAKRRTGRRRIASVDWKKEDQKSTAEQSGHEAGSRVNIQPFVKGDKTPPPRGHLS